MTPESLHILFLSSVCQPRVALQFSRDIGQNPRQPYASLLEIQVAQRRHTYHFSTLNSELVPKEVGMHAFLHQNIRKPVITYALHMQFQYVKILAK